MKNLVHLLFITIITLSIFSCKEDDSLAISQDQLLRANKWKLKEIRTVKSKTTQTDKLLECERQSTLDFSDLTKYYSVAYKTENNNCNQTQTEGTYTYNTGTAKRTLTITPTNAKKKYYYVSQLDPYFLVIQDTLRTIDTINKADTIYFRQQVFVPFK